MIRGYIKRWLTPSEDIVYYLDSKLRIQLSEIVHDVFKDYVSGGLHALVGYVHRPSFSPVTHPANRSTVEECLDKLKDACLHRIREAFDRECSITTTLQICRFEAYRDIYKEHYAAMYEQHIVSDDLLSTLGGAVGDFVEKIEELRAHVDPAKAIPLAPKLQDIMAVIRLKNDPVEYQNAEALKIMAEVRSYYDCKCLSRSTGTTLSELCTCSQWQ